MPLIPLPRVKPNCLQCHRPHLREAELCPSCFSGERSYKPPVCDCGQPAVIVLIVPVLIVDKKRSQEKTVSELMPLCPACLELEFSLHRLTEI